MTLKDALQRGRISYSQMAKRIGIAKSSLARTVNYGEYPLRTGVDTIQRKISAELEKAGIDPARVEWPRLGVRPGYDPSHREAKTGGAVETHLPVEAQHNSTEEIELMQLDRNTLALFGLRTNPFLNDVETEEDVFQHKGYQYVSQAIRDAIEQRGFIAVVANSGAGKTTIWDGIESEYGTRPDVVIAKPQLKAKEKLTPEHLCRALIYSLVGDDTRIALDGEDRGRQLSAALRSIRTGTLDRKAVLYIDDAHFCSASCLRQLKTFFEEKIGRFRLLAIVLVGLPELKHKLAAFPEIGNRIRLVEVPPVPVKDYLAFKLQRVGSGLDKLFDGGGLEAFLDRFRAGKRGSLGEPLIVNATCIRAMCKLYENGGQPGERITREIIDQLPGAAPVRRMA